MQMSMQIFILNPLILIINCRLYKVFKTAFSIYFRLLKNLPQLVVLASCSVSHTHIVAELSRITHLHVHNEHFDMKLKLKLKTTFNVP